MILFVLSCFNFTPPEDFSVEEITELWRRDPIKAMIQIEQRSNEEKIYIVRTIIENPALKNSPKLCHVLSQNDRKHCENLMLRSHIWEYNIIRQNQQQDKSAKRFGGDRNLVPKMDLELPEIKPTYLELCQQNDLGWCYQQEANSAVQRGDFKKAAGFCQAINETKHREECFFQIAELIVSKEMLQGFQWCGHSRTYASHCYAHAIETLSELNQSSTWETLEEKARTIKRIGMTLGSENKTTELSDYFWALVSVNIFKNKRKDLLKNVIPEEVNRHLRAAKAFGFFYTAPREEKSLSDWKQEIETATEITWPKKNIRIRDLWPRINTPMEANFQSTYYLSLARRPHLDDTDLDWSIVIVLALIQHGFPISPSIQDEANSNELTWLVERSTRQ